MLEELQKLLEYNALTGKLTWLSDRKYSNIKKGDEAGCLDAKGYRVIRLIINGKKKGYKAHRLAYLLHTGNLPVHQIDHINGNKADNAWSNLRDATSSINSSNRKLSSRNRSGTIGVALITQSGKWRAYARDNKYLGEYILLEDAIAARSAAEVLLGNFGPNHGTL